MTRTLTCTEVQEEELAERYVAGTLAAELEQSFELHYLSCPACHEDVRLAEAVRHAVAPVHATRARVAFASAGVLIAAGLAAVLLLNRGDASPQLRALGALEQPPIYLGVPLRAAAAPADSLFDAAMTQYNAVDYAAAAAGLERALAAGAAVVPANFFLGASLLQLNRHEAAAAALQRVIAAGESSYRSEARYYRAKALLSLGESSAAARELRQVERSSEIGRAAQELLARIEGLQRR